MEVKQSHKKEEKFNTYSHGFGVALSIIGAWLLLRKVGFNSANATIAVCIYSLSLVLLFAASTLYHSVNNPKLKERFRILDHISIYVLIAGTYTPVALITLIDGNGWTILWVVWGIALFGTILKLFYTGKYEFISLLLYVFMGWLIVFDYQNLVESITAPGLGLLALGGAFYTLGIIFYAARSIPYNHLIWHFFVLGGAISHWVFIYVDVV